MRDNFVAERYDTVSRSLHWLIALMVFAQLAMGKLAEVEPGEEGSLFTVHSGLGFLVLALMLLRLGWRLSHDVPPPPARTPPLLRAVASVTHIGFYVLLVLLPLSGWLLTSAEGEAASFFGAFAVPALPVPGGEDSEDLIEETHELLGNVVLALAALHVLAALKHHFIDRDDVLRRMLPH
jgi:cytochrome b561